MIEIPLAYEPDSLMLFERLLSLPRPALLHSADRGHPQARYDIMAADPVHWLDYDGRHCRVDGRPRAEADPLAVLRSLVPQAGPAATHFRAGFIGYFGFPLLHDRTRAGALPADPTGLPQLAGGIYAWAIVTDHHRQTTRLVAKDGLGSAYLRPLMRRIEAACRQRQFAVPELGFEQPPIEAYRAAFARVQDYLRAGDCYQVNLARHFMGRPRHAWGCGEGLGWPLYRGLQRLQPGAFSAYLDTPEGRVLSFSPERLLRFRPDLAETSPIKGTAPRSTDPDYDRRLLQALMASDKNRAENLMIVDLLRNDLGKVCQPGSIEVTKLFEPLRLANAHHLVSTIHGVPAAGVDAPAALAALFPGGSITGAPKLRAMQIINELEPVGRSVYCGSVGFLDESGLMDANIAIRTLVAEADRVHCWGGGGIVADSDCDEELAEIDTKIGRLLQCMNGTSRRSSSA